MLDAIDLLLKAVPPFKKKPSAGNGAPTGSDTQPDDQDGQAGSSLDDDQDGDGISDDQDGDGDGDGIPDDDEGDPDDEGGEEDPDDDDLPPGEGEAGGDDPQSLIQQLADAERDYYAAKGYHGAQHHNTGALLDQYHKLVRKLVRATQGGQGLPDPQSSQPGQQAKPGQEEQSMGPGEEDGEVPEGDEEDPEGEEDPDAEDDAASFGGEDDDSSGKKKNPFGKSMERLFRAEGLRKGLDGFTDSETSVDIPDRFLMPYLVSFVETSYGVVSQESPEHMYDAQAMAERVMRQLVHSIGSSRNLRRAASRYQLTQDAVAKILRDRQIISATQALASKSPLPTDEESNDAMQASGMSGAVFQLSQDSDWFKALPAEQHALSSTSVLSFAPSEQLQVRFEERPDPNFRKSFDYAAGVPERETLVKASIDGKCHIHGFAAVQQTNMLSHEFVTCSCPR